MKRVIRNRISIPCALFALAFMGGCGGGDDGPGAQGGDIVFGVTPAGNLLRFNKSTPGNVTNIGAITGLGGGESIVGLDFRPSNGQLYAVSSANRLYTINTSTAVATSVGAAFTPGLGGSTSGVDFNPTVDRLRIVTASEQNLRINPDTGATAAVDTNLVYTAGDPNAGNTPDIVAAAYSNNANPAPASTTLFAIDTSRDALARVGGIAGTPSPNGGALATIGALEVDAQSGPVGFDISGNGTALAVMQVGGTRGLYSVNLATGAVTLIGALGADVSEIAITL